MIVALDGMWAVWGVEHIHIDRDNLRHYTLLFGRNVVLRRPVTRIALADIEQVQIVRDTETASIEIASRSEDTAFGWYMTMDDKCWVRNVVRLAAGNDTRLDG